MNNNLSDVFALHYEATPNILIGRWLRNIADRSLLPPQEQLLSAALQNNRCRFWLLDMSSQHDFSTALLDWLGLLLTQQVVTILGSPVFVACVAAERHRTAIESIGTETMLRQQTRHEFYPYFFVNETDARIWLGQSQDHKHRPPKPKQ